MVIATLAGALLLLGLFAPAAVFREPSGLDTGNGAIRGSALRVVLVWCCAWPIALVQRTTGAGRLRALWALGAVLLLVHIAIAFHAGHGWSHTAAWEHTRAVGGYGDGLFVNYLFALVWVADVVWAWVAFGAYVARPAWVTWAVHGLFAFIVFNAAVVFGGWLSRAVFCVGFGAGVWLASSYRR
ncbi:MAG TPA: hypothetical protein VGE74_03175 [Gemmata sp.]